MRILDLAVIGLYAIAMPAIGRYYKWRVRTADEYLLGARSMSPLMVGLSLVRHTDQHHGLVRPQTRGENGLMFDSAIRDGSRFRKRLPSPFPCRYAASTR